MADRPGPPPRAMGGWGIGFLAFNAMIGAGIFGLPGKLDAALGAFAPWLLLLAGIAVMGIALCYADLASRFDRNGGPQLYTATAFGNFAGFQAGWMNWSSRVAATAANAVVLAAYAAVFIPVSEIALACAAILIATVLNLAALGRVVATLGLLSLVKLIPLLLVAILALASSGAASGAALPTFDAAEGVALAALYAFVGFEAATVPAGETREPKRAIPLALLATLALVTATYVLIQLAYSGAGLGASDTPLADLAQLSLGPAGSLLIAATATVSVLANLSGALAAMPRVTAAMAEQGELPRIFDRRSESGAPVVSVFAYGGLALGLAVSGTFVFLAVVSTLARLFVYGLCALAIPVLDRRAQTPVRLLRGILLPAAVILFCLWAASQSGMNEWLTFFGFLLAGAILFALARMAARRG
jgi:amino acid transporter